MEQLLATLALYLLIDFQVAREYPVDARRRDGAAQTALALAVLVTGLLWPLVFWKAMRQDWDNHYRD